MPRPRTEFVTNTDADVAVDYRQRGAGHTAVALEARKRERRASTARLAIFFVMLAVALYVARQSTLLLTISICVGVVLFATAAFAQRRARSIASLNESLAHECADGVARVHRSWSDLPSDNAPNIPLDHPFADDLGVYGNASIAKLLGPTSVPGARQLVAEWLLAEVPPVETEIQSRQSAVRELAPFAEWREKLAVLAGRPAVGATAVTDFLTWAEAPGQTLSRGMVWTARVLTPFATIAFAWALRDRSALPFVVLSIGANLLLTSVVAKRMREQLIAASPRGLDMMDVSRVVEHVGAIQFANERLRHLQSGVDPRRASTFRSLAQIAMCGEARLSPLGHGVLQAFVLWDFHVVAALDAWRASHGARVRARFDALAELETLAALSALAHDNPGWCWPVIESAPADTIVAENIAHPLIPADTRVANDVTVGPRGNFVLVTGSNMAGKSTLLRSVGLNALLAQLGAPACATSFSLPRVRIRTVIQVRDSLERGTSLFMAELVRIRDVVDAARTTHDPLLLFLADEMLHGTNAEDRRIACISVIEVLLDAGAIGVVATHVSGLDKEPTLAPRTRSVHFTETYERAAAGTRMVFDYRLRPGPATSRNALALLETIGLGLRAAGTKGP